jgi:NAD(P)-dependent dehydrogenase (short-subunit alcohol dehydrogenase family)
MNMPWKTAAVIGASSGIGKAIADRLAAEGCKVALVGRREDALNVAASAMNGSSAGRARVYIQDVTNYASAEETLDKIAGELDGIDLVVYSAGIMPKVGATEYDTAKDSRIVETNLIGAMAWLNAAAKRFERQRGGTIIAIGSPSGDRGRRGNPAYGASKAGLEAYMESLRNRLAAHGVRVATAKPGPVASPMTEHLGRLPGMIGAERAAELILRGAAKGSKTFYVPGKWWFIMKVIRAIPSPIFRRMKV